MTDFSKYYRDKLECKEAKYIYNDLLRGLENHQVKIDIPMPASCEGLLNKIANAVFLDNPQLYYVNFGELYKNLLIIPRVGLCLEIYPSYYMSNEMREKMDLDIKAVTRGVLSEAAEKKTLAAQCWVLYNWLLKAKGRCRKDYEKSMNATTIIGPLLCREYGATCEGYAKAFKYLSDCLLDSQAVNLSERQHNGCVVATGDVRDLASGEESGHAWNIIIEEEGEHHQRHYHCDIAYEPDTEVEMDQAKFFMISKEEIITNRTMDDDCIVATEGGAVYSYPLETTDTLWYGKEQVDPWCSGEPDNPRHTEDQDEPWGVEEPEDSRLVKEPNYIWEKSLKNPRSLITINGAVYINGSVNIVIKE